MHRYRIVAQFSLIISILNLVLAAPMAVQEIHEARDDDSETAVAEDVPAMPKKSDGLEAAWQPSDRPTSPRPSSDAMASPQHSSLSDGSATSGYPAPYLSSGSSDSGYSWLLDRPPRLSPNLPASPHPSISGSSETPLTAWLQGLASEEIPPLHPAAWQGLAPEIPPSPPAVWHGLVHPLPLSSSSGSSESDRATTETYSPTDKFTPSHYPSSLSSTQWYSDESMSTPHSSASGASLSSHYYSASADGGSVPSHDLIPMLEGLAPSHHLTPDGSPTPPSSPPTETPPDNVEFFNKDMMKKLKIVASVAVIGTAIAGIVGLQIKHRDS